MKNEKAEKNGDMGYVEVVRVNTQADGVGSSSDILIFLDNGATQHINRKPWSNFFFASKMASVLDLA